MRVAGSVKLKHNTPTQAHSHPRVSVFAFDSVTLPFSFTLYDNTMTANEEGGSNKQRVLLELTELIQRKLHPGDRLPSVRELTRRYRAGPVTVSGVLAQLAREGQIVTRPGHGTFVAAPTTAAPAVDLAWQTLALAGRAALPGYIQDLFRTPPPDSLPLGSGYPDESVQPLNLLQTALGRASRRPGLWARPPPEGVEALRAWFARELGEAYRASDVLIVPGGQAALSTALRALIPIGAPLLVESPTYYGVLAAAGAAGIPTVPVPADADGVRPDLLDAAFRATGAKAVYLQPLYANPTGAVLTPHRRAAVLAAAERAGAFVIEDDYARGLTLDGEAPLPLAAVAPGRVVYLRSLTKLTAPGLRVAALVARGPAFTRLRHARVVEEYFQAAPLQETALDVVTSRGWSRHLNSLQTALRERRDALTTAARLHWPQASVTLVPAGGYNVWVKLPGGMSDVEFAERAARAGVHVGAGSGFFPAEPDGAFLRLSYAAARPSAIEEGIVRLASLASAG